jgi:hypothetical protein
MNKYLSFILFLGVVHILAAQETPDTGLDTTLVDTKYREDQFYVAVTYDLLINKPEGLSQSSFSSGFHFGFIRDFPINKKRNLAIGIGLGLSTNSYHQNLLILEDDADNFSYSIIDKNEVTFTKNKFSTYLIEVPLEFRWRKSTPTQYRFWRIYSGLKLGYVFANSAKFNGTLGNSKSSNINDFKDLQYGFTLGAGYGTWNFHLYYGLNSIFKSNARIENKRIDLKSVKIGLIFYIL